jgi:hypothetical protein
MTDQTPSLLAITGGDFDLLVDVRTWTAVVELPLINSIDND